MSNQFKTILFLSLCFFTSHALMGQRSIRLPQFEKLANCADHSSFDTEARKLGYSYLRKDPRKERDKYVYVKEMETKEMEFTLHLSYLDYGDDRPVILFMCSSNALPNQILDLKKDIGKPGSNYKAQDRDCKEKHDNPLMASSVENNYLAFCFESKTHDLRLYDYPRKNKSGNRYNEYRVRINRR
ncbi:MAG: hypothetical protein AAFV95_00505 [Bacteroidota bacterium]